MSYCNILIVDDDPEDAEILKDAFLSSGVKHVANVFSAKGALAFLDEFETADGLPKLIICDLYLYDTPGDELLIQLKSSPKYQHIPVVMLSTLKLHKESDKYNLMGADAFFTKPLGFAEFDKLVVELKNKYLI